MAGNKNTISAAKNSRTTAGFFFFFFIETVLLFGLFFTEYIIICAGFQLLFYVHLQDERNIAIIIVNMICG